MYYLLIYSVHNSGDNSKFSCSVKPNCDAFKHSFFCRGGGGGGGGGGGSSPTENICYIIFVEGKQSYQKLLTGSKNIDPSRIYRIFKIAKYIQLPCSRALYSKLSQNFDTKNLSSPTVF